MTKEVFIEAIKQMTVVELNELVKAIEQEFGVSAAAPMMMAAAAPTVAATEAAPEKTEFDVYIKNVGDKKIEVIKVIRQITNLGLKEAKDLAEDSSKPVAKGVSKEEAQKIKKQLEEAGAQVELK
ncbi:MAG: 50S ribosomal protein L7/L12 [Spirochaetes bacterium]|nr:50S ribosomal protein L7/L12 [Spirochaetota bacterium]